MVLVNLLLNPVYMAQEEIGIQYRLAGADGVPADYLAHFNHGWHYFLSYLVYKSYAQFPLVNWYTILLLFCQWMAITFIGRSIFQKFAATRGWIYFLLYLLFISTPFLLSLNLTGTSIQLALAAVSIVWTTEENRPRIRNVCLSAILLIVAGMLRMHTVALMLLLVAPYMLFTIGLSKSVRSGLGVHIAIPVILILNALQVAHYRKEIPDWDKQEEFRQALFSIANYPINPNKADQEMKPTCDFLRASITWDTQYVTTDKLNVLHKQAKEPRLIWTNTINPEWYWLLRNNSFTIVFCLIMTLFVLAKDPRKIKRLLPGIAFSLLLAWVLWTRFKLTHEIMLAMAAAYLFAIFHLLSSRSLAERNRKADIPITGILWALSIGWGIRGITQLNAVYSTRADAWGRIQTEINTHPNHFFIFTEIPGVKRTIPIWTSPNQLPLPNTLAGLRRSFQHTGHLNMYHEIVRGGFPDSSYSEIVFVGDSTRTVESTYPKIKLSAPLPAFKAMTVRKVEKP